jgi:hypothetical protein
MLSVLFAALTAVTPAPQATPPLKVIVNIRSSSLCSAVKDTAAPIAYVSNRNEQAFADVNHSMLQLMQNMAGVTQAGAADLRAMDNSLDDSEMYTPSSELSVTQMDRVAYIIAQNLTTEDKIMDASWKQYPRGKYPNLDALRQRMQNLMDLQRALDNYYFQFTGIYLDNRGQARFNGDASGGGSAALFKSIVRDTILGLGAALQDVRVDGDAEIAAKADVHDLARNGGVQDVVKELRLQELAFGKEIETAGKTCGY